MAKSAYDDYYSNQFDQDRRREVFIRGISDNWRKKINRMIERIKPYVNSNSHLTCLDVGTGPGTTLEFLRSEFGENRQLSLFAIEPSISCRSHLQDMDVTVLSRYVEDEWDRSVPEFDIIVMRHVLEHFYDPLTMLQKVSSRLKKSGILYIAVPDLLCLMPRFFKVHLVPGHMSYFSRTTFARTMALAGLEPYTLESESKEIWSVLRVSNGGRPIYDSQVENQYSVNRKWVNEQLKKETFTVATFAWVQRLKSIAKIALKLSRP